MKQPVTPEQTQVRESATTHIAHHPLPTVDHQIVKLEGVLGVESAGTHLALIWLHLYSRKRFYLHTREYENLVFTGPYSLQTLQVCRSANNYTCFGDTCSLHHDYLLIYFDPEGEGS
jgi:hypothetical protein